MNESKDKIDFRYEEKEQSVVAELQFTLPYTWTQRSEALTNANLAEIVLSVNAIPDARQMTGFSVFTRYHCVRQRGSCSISGFREEMTTRFPKVRKFIGRFC